MQINGRKEERLGRREEKGQILNRSIILTAGFFNFSLSSSLTLRNPLFYGVSCFRIDYDTIIRFQYLTDKKRTNASNQTAVNILAVCLQKKAREMVSLFRRRQLSIIKEEWKAVNRQIKVLIAVSLIFSSLGLPPSFRGFAARPNACSRSTVTQKKNRRLLTVCFL